MGEVATGKRVGGGEVAIGDAGQSRCTRRGGLLACEGEGGGRGGGERCAENVRRTREACPRGRKEVITSCVTISGQLTYGMVCTGRGDPSPLIRLRIYCIWTTGNPLHPRDHLPGEREVFEVIRVGPSIAWTSSASRTGETMEGESWGALVGCPQGYAVRLGPTTPLFGDHQASANKLHLGA